MKTLGIGAAVLSAAAAALSAPPMQADQSAYEEPARPWTSVEQAERLRECRDRIEQVRAAAGKPKLEREPANPDKPLLMYAVDTRIDDCGVIVPVADPSDLRQAPPPGIARMIPALPGK